MGRGFTNEQKKLFHSQLAAMHPKRGPGKSGRGQNTGAQGYVTQGATTVSGATQAARPLSILYDPPDARNP